MTPEHDRLGYHAATMGGVTQGSRVTVIGDGAVGLLAVLSAKRLGAEQIILMGRDQSRTEPTGGRGSPVVLEAAGHIPAYRQASGVVRPGCVVSRVGVPEYDAQPQVLITF